MKQVYPDTTHKICFYYLQNKHKKYGATIVKLYNKVAYA